MAPDNRNREPEIEIWSGGLHWALQKGYRRTDTLESVHEELLLWLENLRELMKELGPKTKVGDVLARAGEHEKYNPDEDDEEEE